MNRTGVLATPQEVEHLRSMLNQPYILGAGGVPPLNPQVEAHRLALEHGLPEIEGYYGCDLATGEFVSA
jgi:hypothetical protein